MDVYIVVIVSLRSTLRFYKLVLGTSLRWSAHLARHPKWCNISIFKFKFFRVRAIIQIQAFSPKDGTNFKFKFFRKAIIQIQIQAFSPKEGTNFKFKFFHLRAVIQTQRFTPFSNSNSKFCPVSKFKLNGSPRFKIQTLSVHFVPNPQYLLSKTKQKTAIFQPRKLLRIQLSRI